MVTAFWVEPSQLVEGARMNKQNQLSLRHRAHKLVSDRKGVDKENTCKESSYLYVWSWEDANSAMVFTFEPVLVNLLVNVNNISFLQRKFPVNNTSTPSELHWRRTDVVFFCPAIPRYQGVHQHVDTHHVPHKAQAKCWELLCSYCDVQDLSCSLGTLSKKLACEGPNNHILSRMNGVKLKPNMTLATFHVGYDEQPSIPVLKQSCHKSLPKRLMILIWASLLIRLTYSHGEVDPAMITLMVSL